MANVLTDAVVPLLAVLIGAALTYWLNVRGRRRMQVDDLFAQAISAVAVADSSQHYLARMGRPATLSEEDHRSLVTRITAAAIENHARREAEAREALAKVVPYEPRVREFYKDPDKLIQQPDAVIELLIQARRGLARRAVPWRVLGRSRSNGPLAGH